MREELAFCRLGPIPHSSFLGWRDVDQAKAIAYERWLSEHCSSCGQRQVEWRDEKGKELVDPPFELVESLCPACAVLEERDRELEEQRKNGQRPRPGLKVGFRRLLEGHEGRGPGG